MDQAERTMLCDSIARQLADGVGSDPTALWRDLCANGWGSLGSEPGDIDMLALAMEEMGAAGAALPLIGAAAAHLLLPGQDDLLAAVRDGSAVIALALGRFDGDRAAGSVELSGERLTGELAGIEDTESATHLLVLAGDGRAGLVALLDDAVRITPTPGYAEPPLARVSLTGAPATLRPSDDAAAERVAGLARILLIARAFGAARRGFAVALDYAGIREQFGQPIARFQAIQHKLADCRVRLDLAEVLLADAAAAFAEDGDCERAVALLVSVAAPALRRCAVEVQHIMGAVGYAEEHEAARLFVRVHADTSRLGGARHARRLIARQLRNAADRHAIFPAAAEPERLTRLRAEVRAWLSEHWGDGAPRDTTRNRDVDRPFIAALAEKGWLTASWPTEYGGPGFDAFEQFAFLEEMRTGGAPVTLISPSYWVVAPSIMAQGSDALKAALLPGMARGEISFALGYSEPQAGSDLAALATRAVRDGDDYVVNGQKIWTSNTEYASHIFLAARTGGDPITAKHSGITVFAVPLDAPGITVQRMKTLHGKTFAVVFFDDVRVPAAMMVAGEGEGWAVLGAALGAERIIMGGQIAGLRGQFAALVQELRRREDMADDPAVWERLAELAAELEAARALSLRSVELVSRGESATIEGAIAKLYSGDLAERIGEVVLDLCGVEAGLSRGAEGALLGGEASHQLRLAIMLVVGGGTAEVQRNVIAQRGLKLPR